MLLYSHVALERMEIGWLVLMILLGYVLCIERDQQKLYIVLFT